MGFAASTAMRYSTEAVPSSNATYSNRCLRYLPRAVLRRSAVAADESWAPCGRIADADVHAARDTRARDRRAPIYVRGGRGVRVGAAGAIRAAGWSRLVSSAGSLPAGRWFESTSRNQLSRQPIAATVQPISATGGNQLVRLVEKQANWCDWSKPQP